MIPFILSNLPYIVVLLAGLAIALDRKRSQPQLASWAIACFGVLIVLWVMRMIQVGWVISAHQQGRWNSDHEMFLTGLGYFRAGVFYLALAALAVGSFRWREDAGESLKKPGMCVAACVILKILGIVIGRSLPVASPLFLIVLACELVSMIMLMTAFYGWRSGYVPDPLPEPSKDVTTVDKVSVVNAVNPQQPAALPSGMFEEKDYIPFVLGVMLLGGLVCVPILWGHFTELGFEKSIIPSMISCGIFVYAHDNRGNFSIMKFLIGMLFVFMIVIRALAQSTGNAKPMFFAGGIVGYIIMFACGWAGIAIARFLRR